jgi:hypothetical protein
MAPATLFLDLGDLFTKGLIVDEEGHARRLRFPSAVARRLLGTEPPTTGDDLVLASGGAPLRPLDFDPAEHPRAASYPGGEEFLHEARGRLDGDAVLCGWLAAAYGADREVLGLKPTVDTVRLLTRKALLAAAPPAGPLTVEFIVDTGLKAQLICQYAASVSGEVSVEGRSLRGGAARLVRPEVRGQVDDAPECAAAFARQDAALRAADRVLVLDVGYFRTKLAIVSETLGCELQSEHADLGVVDCVRRVMRDAQSEGLVGDEYALARALESRRDVVDLAKRRFGIADVVTGAAADLATGVERVVRAELQADFTRSGRPCPGAIIMGGGAVYVGEAVAKLLKAPAVGVKTVRVTTEPSFALVEGARLLVAGKP